ncbi:carbon-nitrogen hydrolase [Basidiobolus meristosporus CBS 931.73]|uniref:Carbon-nitrogen hydrolase n=1 Tax=Basidiobolus meristosporus CBS 931.73 TaxID=1314790 RepID=A0A1Y1XIJ0_9FUNG|nr:carbon-nitrogen hydrolase [Basidiobolus meristosporus CBS 931.73]|eukprot:ORX85577.1 carbon-nitrogen hydrolase [Basidiobolus meristosporus CBS 931.73]
MTTLKIAATQFEAINGQVEHNLNTIERLTIEARAKGCQVISFHECCVQGYTYAKYLSREELLDVAECIPDGPITKRLMDISSSTGVTILAGLFEKDENDNIYNTYICVQNSNLVAKFRKLHPFISQYLSPGNEYVIFDLFGWKCGILICYDNNVIENVRATTLLGAEIIFMPHVTGCTPSPMPGRGFVDPALWANKESDPVSLRQEFDGPKGRGWLMRWLPARAYDNGVYVVFTNPIGMDHDQLKCGHSMILDPYGEILAECHSLESEICCSTLVKDKLRLAGGYRYRNARRPELYNPVFSQPHESTLNVVWLKEDRK